MKFVLVTFKEFSPSRRGKDSETGYVYPALYSSSEVSRLGRGPIYDFEDIADKTGTSQCLIAMPDGIADAYDLDPDMEIINQVRAQAWIDANRTIQSLPEYYVERDMVAALQLRIAAGATLSTQEREMIDPDHPRGGIVRRKKDLASVMAGKNQ